MLKPEVVEAEGLGEREPVRLLLERCKHLLDNPYAVAIAEAALSPTAADKHMKALGWPNTVAAAMRNTVRLRMQHPDQWRELIEPVGDPAAAVYAFSGASKLLPDVALESALRMGGEEWQRERPLLLRQMRCANGNSVFGITFNGPPTLHDVPSSWSAAKLFERLHYGCIIFSQGKEWRMDITGRGSASDSRLSILTQTTKRDYPGGFPDFLFCVEITNQLGRGPMFFERLRFLLDEDLGPENQSGRIGRAVYQRVVVLYAPSDSPATLVQIERPYWVRCFYKGGNTKPSYSLIPEEGEGPNLLHTTGSVGFSSGGSYSTKEALELLIPALLAFRNGHVDEEFPLETVAGVSLLNDPPEELLSLLVS